MNRSELANLARPFPGEYVSRNPSGGGLYVSHSEVVQWLLYHVGPYDFAVVELIRGDVPGKPGDPNGKSERARTGTPDLRGAVVGCLARLSVTIDGQRVTVTEVGDCEAPHNWPHDGARAKDAASDAIKRCAMRVGVGLHLWSGDHYFLRRKLVEQQAAGPDGPREQSDGAEAAPIPALDPDAGTVSSRPRSREVKP